MTSISGFSTAPRTKAPTRRPVGPGPQAPYRSSQYGSVKNGQTRAEKTTTDQRATGLATAASGRTSREENNATPMKTSSAPTEHEDQDLGGAQARHEQSHEHAGETETRSPTRHRRRGTGGNGPAAASRPPGRRRSVAPASRAAPAEGWRAP